MNALKCVLALFAFVGVILVGCSDESQSPIAPSSQGSLDKNIIHNINVTDVPLDFDQQGNIKFLPTGNIQFKKVWVKEDIKAYKLDANGNEVGTDPYATGIMEHFLSTMIDGKTGEGPVHGSFTTYPDPTQAGDGAKWVGSYSGYRSLTDAEDSDGDGKYDAGEWSLQLKLVGHGKGGMIDGWQMFTENTLTIYNFGNDPHFPFPMPQYWSGVGTGFYKEH